MVSQQEEVQIDTNLYSRQIGTFGMEMMGKLIKMNVLIVGCRGLGVETAKNLILAGPASVTIHDPIPVTWGDLSSNFYLRPEHVGKTNRAEASIGKLQELNPYVKVSHVEDLTLEQYANYHVIVFTEIFQNIDRIIEINEFVRQRGIGTILSQNFGAAGYAFVDFGNEHIITDADGEETKSFIVVNVTQENPAIVTVHEDKRHKFQDGDYVQFREVQGMSELNTLEPTLIEVIDGFNFKLKIDATGFGAYTREGLVENIKVPKKVSYHSLKQSLHNPVASSAYGMLETPDLSKFGRSDQIHIAICSIFEFQKKHSRLPGNSESDLEECKTYATTVLEQNKQSEGIVVEELDQAVLKNTVLYAQANIVPMTAFFGGMVAQEIVKFTGKYSPLKQWLHYDIFESLPRTEVNRLPENSRYDDNILVYGREVQEKMKKVKTFMVGAGALGCEYIKTFALIGLGCSKEGKVSVTDNDNIEVSNLNRQFLFRKNNVGHSKSETAAQIAKDINNDLNVQDYQTLVSAQTESVFHDDFWEGLDFVVNAVDNIKARLYVDQRCVWYEKPLLESGTLGTKANSQMIIPHKTQCYGDSQDPPEEAIPMCTLRNFPNQIEHCIEWGRDFFNKLYFDTPNDLVSYISNPQLFVAQLKQNTTMSGVRSTIEEVKKLVDLKKNADFNKCIEVARVQFEKLFNHEIQNLLQIFPHDAKDKDGHPFWSGPKRAPTPISFNPHDPLHALYVAASANLIAYNLGIEGTRDISGIAQKASEVQVPPFQFKKIKIELPGQQQNQEENKEEPSEEDEVVLANLLSQLNVSDLGLTAKDITTAEFEKDDDTNWHIDFIHAASNLRARNYSIPESTHQKTKMIAGKIIPAIATTTAMITGCVTAEMFKFVQGFNAIEDFKNGFINLALPLFVFSEPTEVNKTKSKAYDPILMCATKAIPENYTIYDKIVIQGPLTFQQLFDHLKERFNIDVTLVSSGKMALFNVYLPGGKHEPRRVREIAEVYREISDEPIPDKRKYLALELGGEVIGEGSDFSIPTIKYYFTQ